MTEPLTATWWLQRAFVYVGRMDADKGVLTIVSAWRRLRDTCGDTCPPLWLVGGTPADVEALRREVPGQEGLARDERAGRIHWWGYLDPAGISTVLLRALALVAHSRYEPGGRVVLEAMSEGVPVIATPHGFAAGLVRDWCTGFLVEFGDEEALCQRMEHFVRQPLLRNSLGGAARKAALQALGTWSFLETHREVYLAAVGGPALPDRVAEAADPVPCEIPRFPPTHPYGDRPPAELAVTALVESATGCADVAVIARAERGRSIAWAVSAGVGEWVATWPAPVLRTRPLWDADDGPPAWSHTRRWASGAFAASLPFHLPLAGKDEASGLLLFRCVPPAALDWPDPESCARVADLLRRTVHAAFPEADAVREILDRSWADAPGEELRSAAAALDRAVAGGGRPWHHPARVLLRFEWARRTRDLAAGRLRLPAGFDRDALRAAALFTDLADGETRLEVRACHGSLRVGRVRGDGEQLWLTGGETAHLAFPGEDMALLLTEVSAKAGGTEEEREAYWRAALARVAAREEERLALIGWAGLAALEGMARNHVMRRADRFAAHFAAWRTAVRLAETAASRVIPSP